MAYPLRLKVFKGDTLLETRDFERDHIRIGRLASAHLSLNDEKVSRIHSVIEASPDGRLSILDMGSVEGTFVNGKRINNKGALALGDEIRLGDMRLMVEAVTEAPVADAAAEGGGSEPSSTASGAEPTSTGAEPAEALARTAQAGASAPAAALKQSAIDPSFATTEKLRVVPATPEPAAPERTAPEVAPEPRVARTAAPITREGKNGTALSLRFLWGDHIVTEHLLQPGRSYSGRTRAFLGARTVRGVFEVGTGPGVHLMMDDAAFKAPSFTVAASDARGPRVRFTSKMTGQWVHDGQPMDLRKAVERKAAERDGDAYSLTLSGDDFVSVDLGRIRLEACLQPVPKPVAVPFGETLDYTLLNIFLLVLFLGGLFVVSALNRARAGDVYSDELNSTESRIAKLIVKPPAKQISNNPLLKELAHRKARKAKSPAKRAGHEGKKGHKKAPKHKAHSVAKGKPSSQDQARKMAAALFGKGSVMGNVIGDHNGLGGALKAAVGNMVAANAGNAAGLAGYGIKGSASGGGGNGHTFGISGVGTKGRAGRMSGYGRGTGFMGGKTSVDIGITSSEPVVMGSIDRELVRKVIHSHRDQLRYCYNNELIRHPNLAGKVQVWFVIAARGQVAGARVVSDSSHDPRLGACIITRVRTWIFPKPKGGGRAIVTYPFLFKSSGG